MLGSRSSCGGVQGKNGKCSKGDESDELYFAFAMPEHPDRGFTHFLLQGCESLETLLVESTETGGFTLSSLGRASFQVHRMSTRGEGPFKPLHENAQSLETIAAFIHKKLGLKKVS